MESAVPARTFNPDALRRIRHAHGLSQRKLADRAGLTHRAVSFFETGRCGPSVHPARPRNAPVSSAHPVRRADRDAQPGRLGR
ncbi:helix-turn-helix domain-containing protein [Streptomyces hirsutus]|uniref:Helix-turn-helix domain-containing protein n=1 Tax=Streptomyces hirsutus TaxID=35620 RepID=A0ABZ1GHD2_9ACTN|nr:helix-turn-helix transcriptional regulator [Streptomyces hirsutus]WSD05548.1 helix-turn-helix domain-containing protein [Streptomyces hirsutus]